MSLTLTSPLVKSTFSDEKSSWNNQNQTDYHTLPRHFEMSVDKLSNINGRAFAVQITSPEHQLCFSADEQSTIDICFPSSESSDAAGDHQREVAVFSTVATEEHTFLREFQGGGISLFEEPNQRGTAEEIEDYIRERDCYSQSLYCPHPSCQVRAEKKFYKTTGIHTAICRSVNVAARSVTKENLQKSLSNQASEPWQQGTAKSTQNSAHKTSSHNKDASKLSNQSKKKSRSLASLLPSPLRRYVSKESISRPASSSPSPNLRQHRRDSSAGRSNFQRFDSARSLQEMTIKGIHFTEQSRSFRKPKSSDARGNRDKNDKMVSYAVKNPLAQDVTLPQLTSLYSSMEHEQNLSETERPVVTNCDVQQPQSLIDSKVQQQHTQECHVQNDLMLLTWWEIEEEEGDKRKMSFSEGVPIQQAPIQQMAPIQQPAPIQLFSESAHTAGAYSIGAHTTKPRPFRLQAPIQLFLKECPYSRRQLQQMAPNQQPAPIQLYTLNYPLQLSPLYMMPTREIRAGCLYASDAMAALSPPEAHRLESGIASLVANTITAHYTDPNSSPNPNRDP
ncbi:hypothetical protein C0Q70_18123 [Pomacea canaliculata]|uniref:Uncharacterized protein n=1 Tax=Pomacea canaliculata TaxID=400727 RepID=A0A2T7NMB8_POMCA|nr:hypothetical protein C0Q70_18123 [Pomacea canaliculata]